MYTGESKVNVVAVAAVSASKLISEDSKSFLPKGKILGPG